MFTNWKDKLQIQSKVEELEEVNQALRNRNILKDDAIA
jgi:hypothetical protein